MTPVTATVLSGFDDPVASSAVWERVATASPSSTVFQTWHWQRAWWDTFGRGKLLLIQAARADRPVALAPLFADGGMVFFVGSGGSDYLDFVGDTSDADMLDAILETARAHTLNFVGFRFYLVPDESPTGERLKAAARRLGLACYDEGDLPAPTLQLHDPPAAGQAAADKASLVRHERYFRRDGALAAIRLTDGREILPHLEEFFDQHVARWVNTPYPSLFCDPTQRAFYRRLCEVADRTGWLRFTRIDWAGRPIAFHFGSCFAGRYLWYKPSFAVDLARRSPGELLLRQLLLAAIAEGVDEFDFGIGDEAFKHRFANRVRRVRTWGLYPVGENGP
ncbi:MAG TPA: GNAT family N-acetyltransferase [Gemmataceae bacterium]|jgi:CelD/BcsL family acetyltransferase involved in cellulose biosynthesis|nr:GNAT family N-acetyltransferase [Gemmataceae bacterium]